MRVATRMGRTRRTAGPEDHGKGFGLLRLNLAGV